MNTKQKRDSYPVGYLQYKRVGNVESYNVRNLEDYVDPTGWIKGVSRGNKILVLVNGEVKTLPQIVWMLGCTSENFVRVRLYTRGLVSRDPGQGKRKVQVLVLLDEYVERDLSGSSKYAALHSYQACWSCSNYAVCKWSLNAEPIDGWKAEPTLIRSKETIVPSCKIEYCPEYVQETTDEQAKLFRSDPSYGDSDRYRSNAPIRTLWRRVIQRSCVDYANAVIALGNRVFDKAQHHSGYTGDPVVMASDCEEFFRSDYFRSILDELGITGYCGDDFIDAVRKDPERFATKRNVFEAEIDCYDEVWND